MHPAPVFSLIIRRPPRSTLCPHTTLCRSKVKVSGDLVVQEIVIDPAAVDPEDVEMLQDMVLAAVNEGIRAAQERAESKMGGIAGGLGGGGGLGLPGM